MEAVNIMFKVAKVKLPLAKTVREYLFEGYKDPLLDLINTINNTEFKIPFDKFGWFYNVSKIFFELTILLIAKCLL